MAAEYLTDLWNSMRPSDLASNLVAYREDHLVAVKDLSLPIPQDRSAYVNGRGNVVVEQMGRSPRVELDPKRLAIGILTGDSHQGGRHITALYPVFNQNRTLERVATLDMSPQKADELLDLARLTLAVRRDVIPEAIKAAAGLGESPLLMHNSALPVLLEKITTRQQVDLTGETEPTDLNPSQLIVARQIAIRAHSQRAQVAYRPSDFEILTPEDISGATFLGRKLGFSRHPQLQFDAQKMIFALLNGEFADQKKSFSDQDEVYIYYPYAARGNFSRKNHLSMSLENARELFYRCAEAAFLESPITDAILVDYQAEIKQLTQPLQKNYDFSIVSRL